MFILDEPLKVTPDALYNILLERNIRLRMEPRPPRDASLPMNLSALAKTLTKIDRTCEKQLGVYMDDGAGELAGWFAILPSTEKRAKVQVYANHELSDGLEIMKKLTWSLLANVKSPKLANSWLENLPENGLSVEMILPVMIDLTKKAQEITAQPVDEQPHKDLQTNDVIRPENPDIKKRRERVKALWEEGKNDEEIAKICAVSISTVKTDRYAKGLKSKKRERTG